MNMPEQCLDDILFWAKIDAKYRLWKERRKMEVDVTIDLEDVIDRARDTLIREHGISKGVATDIAVLASVVMGSLHGSWWGEGKDCCLYLVDVLECYTKKFREHAENTDD